MNSLKFLSISEKGQKIDDWTIGNHRGLMVILSISIEYPLWITDKISYTLFCVCFSARVETNGEMSIRRNRRKLEKVWIRVS